MTKERYFIKLPFRKKGQTDFDSTLFCLQDFSYKPLFEDWLVENFGGTSNGRWRLVDYVPDGRTGYCLIVKRKQDAMLFILTWGGELGL